MDKSTLNRITKAIIEAEIGNKHKRLKYLKREANEQNKQLRDNMGFVAISALNKAINQRIKGKRSEWHRVQEKKLTKLFEVATPSPVKARPKNVVHNFSTYELTAEEHHILSYGLDHHIRERLNENEIKTEFESFFYGLKKQLGHLTSDEHDELKTKLRRSCENYYNIKNKDKVDETINKLSKNKNILCLIVFVFLSKTQIFFDEIFLRFWQK